MAKIRPSVWAEDAADVKRIKQKQMSTGHVSDKLVFCILNTKLVLEDILDLIMSRLSTDVFIDCHSTAVFKPDLSIDCVRHMYTKFQYAYVICLCHTMVDFSTPQLCWGAHCTHPEEAQDPQCDG